MYLHPPAWLDLTSKSSNNTSHARGFFVYTHCVNTQDRESKPVVSIDGEHETQTGWLYTMHIEWNDESRSDHELTLSWVDHEHLVGGTISPSVIAKAAAKLAAQHMGKSKLPARFDLSTLRRMLSEFDFQLKTTIGTI